MKTKFGTLVALIILAACNQSNIDTQAEGEKLMSLSREWSAVAGTGDIEKTLGYWADDATVMSPGQPAIKGKEGIRAMVEGMSKIPGFKISWEPLSVSVSKSGDMAYLVEQNQVTVSDSSGNPITQYNKAVTVWRKEADGTWKNVIDMWNGNPTKTK
jgi:uncharacterized protein (TIGR02246 family)